jgi:hypothetical protein
LGRIVIVIVVVMLGVWWIWGGGEAADDAYITFRYSRNVADGYGIVFNPGEAPTQGSTTMLFMLLVAGGIRFGLQPDVAAYLLNGLGLLAICCSLYLIPRKWLKPPFRALLALLVGLHVMLLRNQISGLETNFWTGLILLGILVFEYFRETRSAKWFAALIACSLLACITRPESVLIVGIWWLGILRLDWRRAILGGLILLAFAIPYLLVLHFYFGDILPNPFYLKAGYSKAGELYVGMFVLAYLIFPWVISGLLKFPKTMLLSVYILLVFFVFTDPLVGDNFRFLNPATAVSVFIAGYGLYFLATKYRGNRLLRYAIVAGATYLTLIQPVGAQTLERLQTLSTNVPASPLMRTAQALHDADFPLRVAYGDAGKIPYVATNVTFLDVVGLNEGTIARQANRNGPQWVIDYIFNWHPDLIVFYVDYNGHIVNQGHGVIGTAYSKLYTDPRFAPYELAGVVDYSFDYAAWFIRQDSTHYAAAKAAIRKVATPVNLTITP